MKGSPAWVTATMNDAPAVIAWRARSNRSFRLLCSCRGSHGGTRPLGDPAPFARPVGRAVPVRLFLEPIDDRPQRLQRRQALDHLVAARARVGQKSELAPERPEDLDALD